MKNGSKDAKAHRGRQRAEQTHFCSRGKGGVACHVEGLASFLEELLPMTAFQDGKLRACFGQGCCLRLDGCINSFQMVLVSDGSLAFWRITTP